MRAVLGIDAAWTTTQPTGVALVIEQDGVWRCKGAAPSYESFMSLAAGTEINWDQTSHSGSQPEMYALIRAAERLGEARVELVAIDMPLGRKDITGRRKADDDVSREFGSRLCSTHSPSASRPGILGKRLRDGLIDAGYCLATTTMHSSEKSFIEVYPHPALLSLLKLEKRVPYKVMNSKKYWSHEDKPNRIANLLKEMTALHAALEEAFGPLHLKLPSTSDTFTMLKKYEDVLDALICAWVGVEHLLGRTTPLGEYDAAIWCPNDVVRINRL